MDVILREPRYSHEKLQSNQRSVNKKKKRTLDTFDSLKPVIIERKRHKWNRRLGKVKKTFYLYLTTESLVSFSFSLVENFG